MKVKSFLLHLGKQIQVIAQRLFKKFNAFDDVLRVNKIIVDMTAVGFCVIKCRSSTQRCTNPGGLENNSCHVQRGDHLFKLDFFDVTSP